MCAILGIVSKEINNNLFLKMLKTMKNRGKDSRGIFKDKGIMLGHNRLAIRDLKKGKQPMKYHNYVIVYNGEIYNYDELKKDLLKLGYNFKTNCDTEVVLKGYDAYKEKLLDKLDGIFAFAIYNKKNKKIFLARDRFGVKPLYYARKKGCFIFASEMKAILKSKEFDAILTKKEIGSLLALGPSHIYGGSILKDIYELAPAHYMIFKKGKIKIKRYWHLKYKPCYDDFETAKKKVRKYVEDSIKRQMVSDVNIATLLSGGLDSSIITAVVARNLDKQLTTYSIDYENNDKYFKHNSFTIDIDKKYIEIMSREFHTHHKFKVIPQNEVIKLLDNTLYLRDYPGMTDIDSSLYWFAKQISKEHKVILSGECADEIFGGYPWFYQKNLNNLFPWINNIDDRQKLVNKDLKVNLSKIIKKEYQKTIRTMGLFNRLNKKRRLFYINMTHFMTTLLDRKDRMTMGATIEARVPFASHKLIEYLWNLPFNYKYQKGCEKYLLKEAFKDLLPEEIIERKKNPYPKTHHPYFENEVKKLLSNRLKGGRLGKIFDINEIKKLINSDDKYELPWFGQLMTKPQLMAYLYQIDLWIEKYNIKIIIKK